MAFIERMSILGIRSFSCESQQKIEFFTPVTLILGPNGTGKTTIIECLKYCTTGELPPGSKTGCSFIHDPRIVREVEVKAKVTLQIRDVTGCQMVVSRALVATQREKAKHGTMKTLDGSIKRQSADGRITSMSSKCAEIDREMVTSLGVSKAVLENVIFCHQEDSNWPLQEAKSVKQRFDDLFASSRYVKALDVIRKCKQDKDANVRIYKTELKHLTKNRDGANQLQSERELLLSSVGQQQDRLASVTQKLDPIAERLTIYRKRYTELIQLQAQVKSCESEKKQLEEIISDLLGKIQNEFVGTTEELKTAIDDADLVYANKENSIANLERQLETARSRLRTCESDQTKLLVEKAQLQMEVKTQREAVANRDGLLQSFVRQFNLRPACPQFLSPECELAKSDVQLIVSDLKEAVIRSEDHLAEVKRTTDSEERAAQSQLDSAREKLTRLEQKVEATEKLLRDGDAETVELKLRLKNGRAGAEQLESLRVELLQAEKLVADLSDSDDLCRLRSRSEELARQQQDVETDLHSLDEKIDLFQQTATQRREWEQLTSEKSTKLESARRMRSRHLDVLEQVLASLPVPPTLSEDTIQKELTGRRQCHVTRAGPHPYRSQLRQAFLSRLGQLEQETKETRRHLENLQHERSGLETKTKYLRSQLQDKQNHSRRLEDNILAIAGTLEVEDSLIRLQQKRKVLDEECANEQGSLYLWQKFRDRLTHVDSDCPVCHRQLDSGTGRQELLIELDQRIRSMPDDFARKKQELAKLVEQHEALLQLRPTALELKQLKEDLLPSLERELTREVERLHKTCTVCEEETARLEAFQADESLAKSIQGDLAVLERVESEVLEVSEKLQHLGSGKEKIAGEQEEAYSLDDLQEQRKQLRAKHTSLSTETRDCHQQIDALNQNSRQAIGEVHRLKAAILEAEQEHQANLRLTLDLDRLTQRCQQLRSELQTYRSDQLPGLQRERNQTAERRRYASDQRETRIQQAVDECNRVRDALRQVNTACQAASSSTAPADRLKTIEERLRLFDGENAALQSEVKETSVQLEDARRVLHEHKLRQRELADCLRLGHLRAQLSDLVSRVGQLTERLASCQAVAGADQDLLKETKRLTAEEEHLQSEKQDVTNQLGQLTAKLEYLDRDLRDKYGNADSEYLDMMYQLKTTELACSDLEMYYKALDRAILAYHATKMTELNKVIKELWKATYCGNDIDYIEICSEEESPTSSASANAGGGNASRSRRTYNYRVVMVKSVGGGATTSSAGVRAGKQDHRHLPSNCTEARLDMRGRCSAGQKVLASLIIRLALAEAFCLHCGVLALDEPTTNLDRENIESLACALVEIIKNRRQQKNFQLLIITHDEDFVELLGRSDYVEQFYLLSRNSDGLSEIRKVPIEEHFH